ncbi:unnamed protein product [Cochlearia groenlandica]
MDDGGVAGFWRGKRDLSVTGVRDRLQGKLVEDQQGRAGDTTEDLVGPKVSEDVAERLHVEAGKPKASVQHERISKKTRSETHLT